MSIPVLSFWHFLGQSVAAVRPSALCGPSRQRRVESGEPWQSPGPTAQTRILPAAALLPRQSSSQLGGGVMTIFGNPCSIIFFFFYGGSKMIDMGNEFWSLMLRLDFLNCCPSLEHWLATFFFSFSHVLFLLLILLLIEKFFNIFSILHFIPLDFDKNADQAFFFFFLKIVPFVLYRHGGMRRFI